MVTSAQGSAADHHPTSKRGHKLVTSSPGGDSHIDTLSVQPVDAAVNPLAAGGDKRRRAMSKAIAVGCSYVDFPDCCAR